MKINPDKVDDAVLALLGLNRFDDDLGPRAWKNFDWDAMNRLCEKGFISDPKSKAKSVALTEAGIKQAEAIMAKLFGENE